MKKFSFKISYISVVKEYFGIISFFTLILGYLGFYTFAARNNLPFVYPDITLVIGLGIICWIFIVGCYFISGGIFKRSSTALKTIIFYFVLAEILQTPFVLFIFFFNYNASFFHSYYERTSNFAKRKRRLLKFRKRKKFFDVALFCLMIGLTLFWDASILISFGFVSSSIDAMKRIRYGIFNWADTLRIILLTPIFIYLFFPSNSDFTIFGLSKTVVSLKMTNNQIIKGQLVFKDDDSYYIADTTYNVKNLYFFIPKKSMAISKSEVLSYQVDTAVITFNKRKGLIDLSK